MRIKFYAAIVNINGDIEIGSHDVECEDTAKSICIGMSEGENEGLRFFIIAITDTSTWAILERVGDTWNAVNYPVIDSKTNPNGALMFR